MFDKEQQRIEAQILQCLQQSDVPKPETLNWTGIPFSGEWGISAPFFPVAAAEARSGKRVNVPQRAQELAELVAEFLGQPEGFSRIEAVKGYLNLYFSTAEYARRVIDEVLEKADDYGRGADKGERTMVEFSQPNTHKAFHIGHLRSMILGAVLSNIIEFAGYEVVRANYPGDIGLHVIQWLWNYEKHHMGETPDKDITRWMGDLYAEAVQRLAQDPDLESEVRATYARWNAADLELLQLWRETRQWSIDGFMEIYALMGVRFDRFYYPSEEDEAGKAMVADLIARGIAEDERPEGPVIVRVDDQLGLKKDKYRVAVILRSDGTALYATWDMSLARKKYAEYNLDHSLYVVDVRQSLHFQQIFKIVEIAGYKTEAAVCEHIPYELVNLPGNVTMASRDGTVVLLEDLIREAISRAGEIAQERNADLTAEQRDVVAKAVGLAAIKFPIVARENTKIATFDWETALDFDGQAAPYIQYAHVRCASILRRVDEPLPESLLPTYELSPAEIELVDLLSQMPETVQNAAVECKPLHITNLAYELARGFNNFYNQCPVLQADPEIRAVRLRIVAAAKQALANCLRLLTIEAPEFM
ncbi:MAG: arginine--tRNA ligase [Anaerolineales bacterium]|nr:arginine--tRNA ligase [Anaerolineales bacterium]